MIQMKITSWNVAHLDRLVEPSLNSTKLKRRNAFAQEVKRINPDIFSLVEGPKGEAAIDQVRHDLFDDEWVAVKASDGKYATLGDQWIWFLIKSSLSGKASLLKVDVFDAFAGKSWKVHYWGDFSEENAKHYRHPQVLILDWNGLQIDFIGVHLKSKFINQGVSMWEAGGDSQKEFIREALKARVKMTTEAANIRNYIEARFTQTVTPAIFVMGDFNDGPGKEYFEEQYLFFDLLSNIEGDVFFASRFLNHALFDYPDHLRWTVKFKDFVDPNRDPHILLDHILFTQGLVDGSLPWKVGPQAGIVEHEIHDQINATLPQSSKTSDHKPVSLMVQVATE